MSSFSKFCSQESKNEQKEESKSTNEKLKETYEDLKDLNEDELTLKLYEEVKRQKDNGAFNYSALLENVERLRAFIPNETYQNMKNMLEKIK